MQWSELGLSADGATGLGAGRVSGKVVPGAPAEIPDPAHGRTVATVGWAEVQEVDRAVRDAADAMREWARTDVRERARALRAVADDLRALASPLGDLICAESGKRLEEAVAEVHFSARYFDWFADAATRIDGWTYETPQRHFQVERRPAGVVAAVSPWNFPLSIPARKLAAALAAGCGVVQKPSERSPISTLVLTAVCERHLPVGLVAALVGDGEELTGALIDHPAVRVVTFTGSTRVGRVVAERCGREFTHAVLELGGRAPFIVCQDADVDTAVDALMVAKLRNNGESCLAANNVFVHADRYDAVLSGLRDRLADLRVGDPRDPGTGLGPQIRPSEVERLSGLVDGARRAGAPVESFGAMPDAGWYAPATVIEGGAGSGDAWSSETFGPVFSVASFTDVSAVVDEVNGWPTGLGGYVVGTDPEQRLALARRLDLGIVGVNNGAPNTPEVPFGGRGQSGLGREGGLSGLLEFTTEHTVSLAR